MNREDKLKAEADKARAVYDAVNTALKPLPPSKYKREVLNAAWSGMGATGAALENHREAKLKPAVEKRWAYLQECAKLLNWVTLPPIANEQQIADWINVAEICLSYRDIPLPEAEAVESVATETAACPLDEEAAAG